VTESAAAIVFAALTRPDSGQMIDSRSFVDRGTLTDLGKQYTVFGGMCLSAIAAFDELYTSDAAACALAPEAAPMRKA
jgi:hypothetical protein